MELSLSRKTLAEALLLSEALLADIELSQAPLHVIMLKASRLCRLVGDDEHQAAFNFEASGYPSSPDGIESDVFEAARLAGRVFQSKDETSGETNERARTESVETIEQRIKTSMVALEAAVDPNVSISSANPGQYVQKPQGNAAERNSIRRILLTTRRYWRRVGPSFINM